MKEVVDIQWIEEVDSTNSEALRRLGDLDNLTVLSAVRQTAGRGQRGNSWLASGGENLTFSIVMKFGDGAFGPLEAARQFSITEAVTLGVTDYLVGNGVESSVKWPNDIYVRNKKICGILIENTLRGAFLSSSVIGIGLNVNQRDFPPQLVNPVSMSLLTGRLYDTRLELPKLCDCVLSRLRRGDQRNEYVSRLYRLGSFHEYVVCSTGDTIVARITGVTDSGLLCLETKKGEHKEFAFKEISYII